MTSVLAAPSAAAQPAALGPDHLDGRFSLLAWRSLSIAARPGLLLHVRSGLLRVREGGGAKTRIVRAGDCVAPRRNDRIELHAYTHAELRIEWPATPLARAFH
jgi:hypothetical protein